MFAFRASHGPVDLAFTDRFGGVSGSPYDELDLALVGDDPAPAREENLRRTLEAFAPDARLAPPMTQVHGADVARIVAGDVAHAAASTCDGQVTDEPDLVLVVRVADCVPVVLADADAGVVGVAHAGRPGLVAGVVPATVTRMQELGARTLTAWLGPRICGACYEVPAQMQDEVAAVVPESRATTSWGTPSLDIGAGVRAQLEALGVEVVDVGMCTRESPDLYSYRRDGARAGRFAGLVRRRSR